MAESTALPAIGKDYKIVRVRLNEDDLEASFVEFENQVRLYMENGYDVHEGLEIYQPVSYTNRWLFQIMVKVR
jgi:hypothetical protein